MDDAHKELVKRLRVHFRSVNASGLPCMTPRNPDGYAAAFALEALAGEVARTRADAIGSCEALAEGIRRRDEDIVSLVAERDRLKAALGDVMEWIDNWSPPFTQDGEWSETELKARKALGDAS